MSDHKTIRAITIILGGIWFLDGVLQLQPAMFTNGFVSGVLTPNLQNQSHIISSIVAFGIRVFSVNIFWTNLAAALMQLLIGILLIFPFRKSILNFGLWLSIGWALVVWIFGEGFGNIFTGQATFFTGAPGAALLYLILAVFLLCAEKNSSAINYLPVAAGAIVFGSAMLNIAPMFWQPTMLSMLAMVPAASNWLGSLSVTWGVIGNGVAFLMLFLGGIFLMYYPSKTFAWITIGFLAVIWWLGQNFGGIFSFPFGVATDPNTAPLLALCLLPIFLSQKSIIGLADA